MLSTAKQTLTPEEKIKKSLLKKHETINKK